MIDDRVTLRVGPRALPYATDYSVETDLLTPADGFSLTFPGTRELWDATQPDEEVEVRVGDATIITGYIDRRRRQVEKREQRISITGRDKVGRLVDESMEPGWIKGLAIEPFVLACAQPWFGRVLFENTDNRDALRGVHTNRAHHGHRYRVGQKTGKTVEFSNARSRARAPALAPATRQRLASAQAVALGVAPRQDLILAPLGTEQAAQAFLDSEPLGRTGSVLEALGKAAKTDAYAAGVLRAQQGADTGGTRIQPGNSRWQTIVTFLEDTGLLCWGTADGTALVVGLPNYDQAPSYRFLIPKFGSDRAAEGDVEEAEIEDSLENRYALIEVYGHRQGKRKQKASALKTHGVVRNGPAADGTGLEFQRPKKLIIADGDTRSQRDADERARREMGERDAHGRAITLRVAGHSQSLDGGRTWVRFAPDTMAEVVDEETGETGLYLVVAVTFTGSRGSRRSQLRLVPKGALLRL